MKFPAITICKAVEVVEKIRAAEQAGRPYSAVISIEHPGADTPERGRAPRLEEHFDPTWRKKQLILTMWDVEQPHPDGPRRDHIQAALDHADKLRPVNGAENILIHCRQAKARSTGTALALLRHRMGPGSEQACLTHLLQLVPKAAPNLLVVQHADAILGSDGKLIAAVTADPGITLRRAAAEQRRQQQIASGAFTDFEKLPQPPDPALPNKGKPHDLTS